MCDALCRICNCNGTYSPLWNNTGGEDWRIFYEKEGKEACPVIEEGAVAKVGKHFFGQTKVECLNFRYKP